MIAPALVLTALVGNWMHRVFWRRTNSELGPHTGPLVRYAIGILSALPSVVVVFRAIGGRDWQKLVAAYLSVFMIYGAGDGMAHWRTFRNGEKQEMH